MVEALQTAKQTMVPDLAYRWEVREHARRPHHGQSELTSFRVARGRPLPHP